MTQDWSFSMMCVEQQVRVINDKLLHKQHGDIDANILSVIHFLMQVKLWANQEDERKIVLNRDRLEFQAEQA